MYLYFPSYLILKTSGGNNRYLAYSFKMIGTLPNSREDRIYSPWDIFEGQRFGNAVSLYTNEFLPLETIFFLPNLLRRHFKQPGSVSNIDIFL